MSTRELTFSKINEIWYYVINKDQPSAIYEMPNSTTPILEFASDGRDYVTIRLLRKNILFFLIGIIVFVAQKLNMSGMNS